MKYVFIVVLTTNTIKDIFNQRITELWPICRHRPNCVTLPYSTHFQLDADVKRRIVERGTTPIQPLEKLSLRIYCRSPKVSELIMKNNTVAKKSKDVGKETDVVYHFRCTVDECQRRKSDYIGLTTQTLRKRLGQHRYNGSINDHYTSVHNRLPKIEELIANTKVIHRQSIRSRLFIAEAVSIALRKPSLNVQAEFDFILPSCRSRPNQKEVAAPVVAAPVVAVPVVAAPVIAAPVVAAPVVTAPVVAASVSAAPVDAAPVVPIVAAPGVAAPSVTAPVVDVQRHVPRLRPLPHRKM